MSSLQFDSIADGRQPGRLAFTRPDGSVLFLPSGVLDEARRAGGKVVIGHDRATVVFPDALQVI